ncbi:hypothetical protein [Dyadobacter sandarakinus]|uniref:Uncharacterized protein n=1 Tax=Dyadobacter sandarakinus TaxID=2747268 RepID=A0ABX7ICS3_9BACT|nr:hypothetical protein [Dyadobacter sandarakinus]QRR03785.1 hypothetical protein HWI92_24170 [Dyadobacter sandarakinus]
MKLLLHLRSTCSGIFVALLFFAFTNVCLAQEEDFPEITDEEVTEEVAEPEADENMTDQLEMGTLLFSSSSNTPVYGQYKLQIVHLQTYRKTEIWLRRKKNQQHFRDGITNVHYNTLDLPEGDYKIFGWKIESGNVTSFTIANFSLPFTIVAGKVNYFGDYFVNVKEVKNWSPIPKKQTTLIASDRFRIDYDQIKNRFPTLDISNTVSAIPDFQEGNSVYSGIFFKGIGAP